MRLLSGQDLERDKIVITWTREDKDELLNELINDECVFRAALATRGQKNEAEIIYYLTFG